MGATRRLGSVGALLLLCACGQATSPGPLQTGTGAGSGTTGSPLRTMVLVVAPPALSVASGTDSCTGTGAFAALAAGQVVRVLDGTQAVVTTAPLGAGRRSGQADDGCVWSAQVSLPTDARSYRAVIEGWGSSGLLSGEDLHQPMEIKPSG